MGQRAFAEHAQGRHQTSWLSTTGSIGQAGAFRARWSGPKHRDQRARPARPPTCIAPESFDDERAALRERRPPASADPCLADQLMETECSPGAAANAIPSPTRRRRPRQPAPPTSTRLTPPLASARALQLARTMRPASAFAPPYAAPGASATEATRPFHPADASRSAARAAARPPARRGAAASGPGAKTQRRQSGVDSKLSLMRAERPAPGQRASAARARPASR